MDIRKFFQKGSGSKSGEATADKGSKRVSATTEKDDDALEPSPKKTKQITSKKTEGTSATVTKQAPKSGTGTKAAKPKAEISRTFEAREKPTPASTKDKSIANEKTTPASAMPTPLATAAAKGAGGSKNGKERSKRSIVIESDSDFNEEEEAEDDKDSDFEMLEDDEIEVAVVKKGTKRGKVEPKASKDTTTDEPAGKSAALSPGSTRRQPAFLKKAKVEPTADAATPAAAKAPPARSRPAARSSGAAKNAAPDLPPDARAAVAAVDAAIKELPGESEMNMSMGAEGQIQGNDNTPPPNHGAKAAPRGHPDCLSGKTFVITGVLDSLYRHEAEDFVKRHGGKVTKTVSGKTTFLVAGHSCGRTKLTEARAKGTLIIDEDHLFKLVAATSHLVNSSGASTCTLSNGAAATPSLPAVGGSKAATPPAALSALKPSVPASLHGQGTQAAARSSGTPSTSGAAAQNTTGGNANEQLWVDKYKPTCSAELVGNQTLVATLRQWLSRWEAVNLRQEEVQQGKSKNKDMSKKAVLLSGPPGIGKTSSAMIIARECGYDAVEVNASDTRSKHDGKVKEGMNGKLSNVVAEMVTSRCIGTPDGRIRKQVLVMDEVDGMSGGDRGGVSDLIESIKKTKLPIICICNDKYNMKLRSLRNYCMEMDYRRPTTQQICKRMQEIAHEEGLSMNEATMSALIESANGDLRLILGQLQMLRLRTTSLSYDDVKGKMGTSKDADMSPFECARRLLDPASARLSLMDRLELVFMDMDLVPLLVQENYINHRPVIATNDGERLRCISKAADAISMGDTANRLIRQSAAWHLAPFANTVGALMPASYMRGSREAFNPHEFNFTRFTAWLGNYSTSTKQKRLLGELSTQALSSGHIQCNRSSIRLEYAPALRHLLTAPLKNADSKDEKALGSVVGLMQDYCINRELMDYILDVTTFKTTASWNNDPMKEVATTTKSALTRMFNSQGLKAKCGMMVEDVKKGRSKGRAPAAAPNDELVGAEDGEAGELAAVPEVDEDEDEEVDTAALQKDGIVLVAKDTGKGGKAGRGRGSAKASGRGSGRASGSGARGSGRASGRGRGSGKGK